VEWNGAAFSWHDKVGVFDYGPDIGQAEIVIADISDINCSFLHFVQ